MLQTSHGCDQPNSRITSGALKIISNHHNLLAFAIVVDIFGVSNNNGYPGDRTCNAWWRQPCCGAPSQKWPTQSQSGAPDIYTIFFMLS